jgi:hypothetical protein
MPIYLKRAFGNTARNTTRRLLHGAIAIAALLPIVGMRVDAQSTVSIEGARGGVAAGGELDNYLRYLQTTGQVPLAAWGLRPFSAAEVDALTAIKGAHPWKDSWMFKSDSARHFSVLPLAANVGFNSAFPWGSNDGAVWAGRGLTGSLQGGFAAAWGPVSLVVNPIVFSTQNRAFELQPNGESGDGVFRNGDFPNNVDLPQRFGNGSYSRFDWGQSTIRLDWFGVSAGFSTANQYWGPATEFPVILGNNAAGVPHVFLGTERPTNIWIGKLQAKVVYGMERQSDFSPVTGSDTFVDINQSGTKRFMSGLVVTFSPGAIPGLELGVARYFHQAWDGEIDSQLLRTPFEGILKNSIRKGLAIPGHDDKDVLKNQIASLFGRWVLPHSGFEMYAEYGHEDHNADIRDLENEPDHSRIAMVGFRKVFMRSDSTFSALRAEYIDGSEPTLGRHRGEGGAYVHSVIHQGHTEQGQLLGADIGVGSPAGAILAWDRYTRRGVATWYLRRTMQNNYSGLITSDVPYRGAQQLFVSMGYRSHQLGNRSGLHYGVELTAARRSPLLSRELNVKANLGFSSRLLSRR